jgi:hypothetical protein
VTEILQMLLLEDTEKTTLIGGCQIVTLVSLLTADSEKWQYFAEWDGGVCRPRSVDGGAGPRGRLETAYRQY